MYVFIKFMSLNVTGTRVFESVDKNNNIGQLDSSQLSHLQQMTVVRSGSYTLPHPFKTHNGVAGNRRYIHV